tara:strand:+ start:1009 stop:1266 length:258 start_codon:yes stop_codon:yes gene_type:complete
MEYNKCYVEMIYLLKTLQDKDPETNKQIFELVTRSTICLMQGEEMYHKGIFFESLKTIFNTIDSTECLNQKAKFISETVEKIKDL